MSVINQMLRELDARAASERERAGLPPSLRALPPAPRARFGKAGWSAGILLVLVVGSVLGYRAFSEKKESVAQTQSDTTASQATAMTSAALPPVIVQLPTESPVAAAAGPSPGSTDDALKPAVELVTASAGQPLSLQAAPSPVSPAPAQQAEGKPTTRPREMPRQEPKIMPVAPAPSPSPRIALEAKTDDMSHVAETLARAALAAWRGGDPAAAKAQFRQALARDGHSATARQGLLALLAEQRRWDEVREVAEEGLARDDKRVDWALIAARLRFEAGDAERALAVLERHRAHASQMPDYQGFLGMLLARTGRREEAVACYRQATLLKPEEGRWWYGLATTLEALGDRDGARTAYQQALATARLPADLAADAERKLR